MYSLPNFEVNLIRKVETYTQVANMERRVMPTGIWWGNLKERYQKEQLRIHARAEIAQYSDSLRAGRSGDRILVVGQILRTRPDRPWGPPSLLYNRYRVFPGVKRPGRGVDHPPPSSAEVRERIELYLYYPSGPSWPVLG